ncbi:MAG: NHLP bacteriocin export ABC transporter permease/ATPase subunit [Leptolyngbyaceae cyanobacterium bins.59]|nr:NHLP bacteriocin export ABC transporter permease/ATPase subunit [Leptolyngbyaceae cyanobacterium bins.59]
MAPPIDFSDWEPDQIRWIRENQPLLLNDPRWVWIVDAGVVSLFTVQVEAGKPVSTRRYFTTCQPGEALLTMPEVANQERQILVAPVNQARLIGIRHTTFESRLLAKDPTAIAFVTAWMEKLMQGIADLQGGSRSPGMPQTIPSWETLRDLHHQFFQTLAITEAQEWEAESQQFLLRQQISRQAFDEALTEMTDLLRSRQSSPAKIPTRLEAEPGPREFLPLYRVMQAIGQQLETPIRYPAPSQTPYRARDPLEVILQASRLRKRRVLLRDQWWLRDCGPLLAYHREENSPIALLPIAPGRYILFDPVQNRRSPVDGKMLALLSPVAYTFYRPLPDRALSLKELWQFGVRGTDRDWFTVLWTGLGISLLGMFVPIATVLLIDLAIPQANSGLLAQVGLGLLVVILSSTAFQVVQGYAVTRLEATIEPKIQAALWDRLLTLETPFFRRYASGDLRSRASVVNLIRQRLSGAVLRTYFSSGFALLNLGLLFYYNPTLALVALVALLAVTIATWLSIRLMLPQLLLLQELDGKLFGFTVQLVHGIAKLRLTGAEERAFAQWGKQYSQQQHLQLRIQQIRDKLTVWNYLVPGISAVALFGSAVEAFHSTSGMSISVGVFLAFYAAFGSFINGAVGLSNAVAETLTLFALSRRVQPILTTSPEVHKSKTEPGHLSGQITLERVTFAYRSGGVETLKGVEIRVESGECIAIVGPSGSGKSTLLRLLLGFETPQAGRVLYDQQDLRDLNVHAVRRQLGVLLQNSRVATASLFDNIAGNNLITIDDAWEAAHLAGIADDIAAMPMGMHTVISEGGSNLSGGQRQRILIARALALKPQILLFDEATSFLDNQTQAIVSQSLNQLKVTRIVIAHRLSTIREADRIYVLESGQVVQQGTFQNLLSEPGLFQHLMRPQLG